MCRNIVVVFLIGTLLNNAAFAQVLAQPQVQKFVEPLTWVKQYNIPAHEESVNDAQATKDGGYLLLNTTYPNGGQKILRIKRLGPKGEVKWEKTYPMNALSSTVAADSFAYAIKEDLNENLIVATRTQQTGPDTNNVWVMKLTKNGALIWSKVFNLVNPGMLKILPKANGHILIVGLDNQPGDNVDDKTWLMELSADGNRLNEKFFQENNPEQHSVFLSSAVLSNDGGVVVVTVHSAFSLLAPKKPAIGVHRFNANLQLVWSKKFERNEAIYGITGWDVIVTDTGDVVVAGQFLNIVFSPTFAFNSYPFMLQLDEFGNKKSFVLYDLPGTGSGRSEARRVFRDGGGFVLAGYLSFAADTFKYPFLMKVAQNGAIIWEETYEPMQPITQFPFFAKAKDGGYLISGTEQFGVGFYDNRLWAIKTNAAGKTEQCHMKADPQFLYAESPLQEVDSYPLVVDAFSPAVDQAPTVSDASSLTFEQCPM